jgi:hypothetical protein
VLPYVYASEADDARPPQNFPSFANSASEKISRLSCDLWGRTSVSTVRCWLNWHVARSTASGYHAPRCCLRNMAVKGGAFAAVGMNCFARHSVVSLSGDELPLEGDIEDDGDCIDLRTPYDFRDGRFTDVANCVTDHW